MSFLLSNMRPHSSDRHRNSFASSRGSTTSRSSRSGSNCEEDGTGVGGGGSYPQFQESILPSSTPPPPPSSSLTQMNSWIIGLPSSSSSPLLPITSPLATSVPSSPSFGPSPSPLSNSSQDIMMEGDGKKLTQVKHWRMEEKLGQGSYAIVRKGIHTETGEQVAIKIVNLTKLKEVDRLRTRREISIHSSLKHPRIVNVIDVFESNNQQLLFIVMELIDGQDLFHYLKHLNRSRLKEKEVKLLFLQMLSAIHHCHSNSVAHRDLKLENFLLSENAMTIKLCDFGLSNTWSSTSSSSSSSTSLPVPSSSFFSTYVGSPVYMAPEIIRKKPSYCGKAVDIWGLGVVLYTLLIGRQPFVKNGQLITQKIVTSDCSYPSFLSKPCRALLQSMLNPDASRRITSQELLSHPWILNYVRRTPHLFASSSLASPSSIILQTPPLPPSSSSSTTSSSSSRKKTSSSSSASRRKSRFLFICA